MTYAIAELTQAQQTLERAKTIRVISAEQAQDAQTTLATIKGIQKQIEANRTALVAPLNAQVKEINAAYKQPAEFLDSAEGIIKAAIASFIKAQEQRAKEAQAKLDEQARKAQEKLHAQADKAEASGKIETAQALRDNAAIATTTIINTSVKVAGVSVRKQWKAEVVDKTAFVKAALKRPDMQALLNIDESKLNKLAQALQGELSMAGVKSYQEETLAARSAVPF